MDILSLGAGVQSSAVLLMSCKGILPKLDGAIFADTGWEPKAVYDYLGDVLMPAAKLANIPVYCVSGGHILLDWQERIATGSRAASIPFFTTPKPGQDEEGRLGRQCTKEYKIEPVQAKLRELAGKDGKIRLWYGISADEKRRMRFSKVRWIENVYPLIFGLDRPWHRHDCQRWLQEQGFSDAPRSSCIGCPNHDAEEWRAIQKRPFEWRQAVAFDAMIRDEFEQSAYLHRSCKPLATIDFSTPEDRGQQNWISECEGMCGT